MSNGFDALFSLLVFAALVVLLRLVVLRHCDPADSEPPRDDSSEPF